jgi:hypothetical protein
MFAATRYAFRTASSRPASTSSTPGRRWSFRCFPTGGWSSSGSIGTPLTACSSSSRLASSTRARPRSIPRAAAREEAGYEAATWAPLGTLHTLVSYTNERIELFVAEGLSHIGAELDDGEFLEVVTMSLSEMLSALDRGEITDAKTVAALLLYVRQRGR